MLLHYEPVLVLHNDQDGKDPLASYGVLDDGHGGGETKVKLKMYSKFTCLALYSQASISSTAPKIKKLAEKTVKFDGLAIAAVEQFHF